MEEIGKSGVSALFGQGRYSPVNFMEILQQVDFSESEADGDKRVAG